MPGASRAILLIMTADGTQPPQRVQPAKDTLTVGRDASNDIVLADLAVSRHHLTLTRRGAGWRMTRAPEAGPTYLNGHALVSADLRPGDQLALGGMVLRVELPPDDLLAAVLPPGPARTVIAAEPVPTLRVESSGGRFVVPLREPSLTLGRAATCELIIPSRVISTQHATLQRGPDGAYTLLSDEHARNRFTFGGVPVRQHVLHAGETLLIGSRESGEYAAITYAEPAAKPTSAPAAPPPPERVPSVELPPDAGDVVAIIGRDPASDYCLPSPLVSWQHARLSRDATGGVTLEDLGSTNGTFVNLNRITRAHRLALGDIVQIGPHRFTFDGTRLVIPKEAGARPGLRMEAVDLVRTLRGGQTTLLDHVSVAIEPGQFVTIIGGNGAGKTTLLKALAGIQPAQQGAVLFAGVDSYQHYDLFRGRIGYVPQADIVHMALTVEEALSYTARLRLPPDLRDEEIAQRIQLVLAEVDLSAHQHKQVGSLSGGERKRLSLAVELLAEPQVLFLDEPNAALDPNHRLELLRTVRELAQQGRTLLMVTHFREDFEACDRVVVMGRGGRLCFYGPPADALRFFGVARYEDIYSKIEEATDAQAWRKRYQQLQPAARASVTSQAQARNESARQGWNPTESSRHISAARQFRLLLSRYARILARDRVNVAILLLQAPIIGLILALVSTAGAFTSEKGPGDAQQVLFFLALVAVWFGTSNAVREISKESDIYQRERLAGLRILPYVFSKVGILSVLCIVQTLVLLLIISVKTGLPPLSAGLFFSPFVELYIGMTLAGLAGLGMGLFVSALASNPDKAVSAVPLVLLPQALLAGTVFALTGPVVPLADLTVTRWAVQALGTAANVNHLYYTELATLPASTVKQSGPFQPGDFDANPKASNYKVGVRQGVSFADAQDSRRQHLVEMWAVEGVLFVTFVGLAAVRQKAKDPS